MNGEHKCPVCGQYMFPEWNSYDICEFCHWEDSAYQEEVPDAGGGANEMSLNQAKEHWRKHETPVT